MYESILRDDIKALRKLVEELGQEVHEIKRLLKPKFTLHINSGANMAAIIAGQSGSFVLSATASDNSTVVLASPVLLADDPNVTIAPDTTDASGLTFTVTVPATDVTDRSTECDGAGKLEHFCHAAVCHGFAARDDHAFHCSCDIHAGYQPEVSQPSGRQRW